MKTSAIAALIALAACGGAPAPAETTPSASDDEAHKELKRAEERYAEFSQARIDCAGQPSLEDFIRCLRDKVRLLSGKALESAEAFQGVGARREPRWAVASLSGQARTFARMAQTLNDVEIPQIYPRALLEEDVQLSDEARQAVQEQVEANIRQVLETQSAPLACTSVVYDVMALRVAQAERVDSEHSQESVLRLTPLSDERIAECVEQGRTSDETLEPYSAGELDRLQR